MLNNINCAPKIKNNKYNEKKFTCYSNDDLLKLRDLWNKRHPDDMIKGSNEDVKHIWNELREKLKKICDSEKCWLNQNFINTSLGKQIAGYTFAPDAPVSWKKNPNEWLSSIDIISVMKQYENIYRRFKFIGPSPIDFDTVLYDNKCVWEELCNFNIIKYLKRDINKIGFIFNTDKHYQEGSHWVSMFLDLSVDKPYIFFFDSNGTPPQKEIIKFVERIIKQAKKVGLNIEFIVNNKEHQKSDSECGMYSLYMIIQILTGNHNYEYFLKNRIPDKSVEKMRKKYFNI